MKHRPLHKKINRLGYTLPEVMLSMAVIVLIAGFSVPVYQTFQIRNDLDVASGDLAIAIRKAQLFSQTNRQDSQWGVRADQGQIVVFKGDSYLNRDSLYDEVSAVSGTISPTGLQEMVFSKMLGEPDTVGTFILTSINGNVRTLEVNEKGMVEY